MKQQIAGYVLVAWGILLLGACAKPLASFTYSGDLTAPAELKFQNKSKKAKSYQWDFGDGNQSTATSPTHRYSASGRYDVKLQASSGGDVAQFEKSIFVDAPEQCLVEIETDFGNMVVLLYDATPQHRDNFLKLVEEGFYDGLLFHRVVNGFMMQGGDPKSKNAKEGEAIGDGGPGYQIPAEFVDSLIHIKGALAAARTENPDKKSSGSQFYIVHGSKTTSRQLSLNEAKGDYNYSSEQRERYLDKGGAPQLDRLYTVFGQVISGLEVIDLISEEATDEASRPKKDVKMKIRLIQ